MTWKYVLPNIARGYVCVVLFLGVARYTPLNFLFEDIELGGGRNFFPLFYFVSVSLLTVYTVYAVNKIIWFTLRKNGYASAIYGSIRRFLQTYVWCLYVGGIPCFWISCVFFYFSPRDPMGTFISGLCLFAILFSSYLIPLIFFQRLAFTCYLTATNKPIGKPEDNARFWQYTETSMSTTLYAIVCYFTSIIWKFCYWIAMVILLSTVFVCVIYAWLSLSHDKILVGDLQGVAERSLFFGNLFIHISICYLAFSIILQSLFVPVQEICEPPATEKTD